jgi:hypothetical protein
VRAEAEFCVWGAAVKRNFGKTWEVANGEGNLKFNFSKGCIRSMWHKASFGTKSGFVVGLRKITEF